MRPLISILTALVVLCGAASAQITLTGAGSTKAASGGGTYTGPGDVITGALAAYSLQAWTSAKRGTKAISLCDTAGANCADVSTDATTGNLNCTAGTCTRNGTNCSTSGTCLVNKIYDQSTAASCSGPCDLSQATVAKMPVLTPNCSGLKTGLFCLTFNGASAQVLRNTSVFTQAQPLSFYAVSNRTGATTSFGFTIGSQVDLGYSNAANTGDVFAGLHQSFAETDGSWNCTIALVNGASSFVKNNGTNTSAASVGNSSFGGTDINFGGGQFGNNTLTGNQTAMAIWAGDQSASFTSLDTNQRGGSGYWF